MRPEAAVVAGAVVSTSGRGGYANGEEQRRKIVDEVLSELRTRSFGELTLRGVAAAVGISAPGLLRHYPSTDALLSAAMRRMVDDQTRWLADHRIDVSRPEDLVRLAQRDAATAGYVALFAGLVGPAADPAHPGHDFFRRRYRSVERALGTARSDVTGPDAITVMALWDGLQVHALLKPTVSVPDALAYALLGPARGAVAAVGAGRGSGADDRLASDTTAQHAGYTVGRDRRAAIIDGATEVFARLGYHRVTMRQLADELGVAKSSITHYFRTKEDLLQAVLAYRDASVLPRALDPADSARDTLFELAASAASTRDRPGLTRVFAVLSSEAVAPTHPAHDYFVNRMDRVRSYVAELFRRAQATGHLAPERDPASEALVFTALWDGLQIRWLYEPDRVHIADALRVHLERVFAASEERSA